MTVAELSLYIAAAVFLQTAVFASLAILHHWREYQDLKNRLGSFDLGPAGDVGAATTSNSIVAGENARWEGFRDFRVARKLFENESHSICSFHLVPTDDQALPHFEPGQFLTLRLDAGDPTTGERNEIVRCYTLSDRPGLNHYRISVKRALPPANFPALPPGLSSNQLHDFVKEGDILSARAPCGEFFLGLGNGPIVLIAGGIGITPILSMLNASVLEAGSREIFLFYGLRDSSEHIMKAQLQAVAKEHPHVHLHVCYSGPLPGDVKGSNYQHEGHVDINLLRLTLPLKPYDFYVCGPRPMMETLVPALAQWGVPNQNIHYEAFGPASLTGQVKRRTGATEEDPATGPITVTFSRSGKTVIWDQSSESLLEFAENNGVEVNAGCRSGACGSCQTTIEEGNVDYVQAPDFDPDPGCCLLCISRPKSDLSLSA